MLERRWLSVVTGIAVVAAVAWPAAADEPEKLSYTHDVKPILMDSCLACHGADADGRKAGLRLDDRMAAIEAGAIVPGDAEASEAVLRIFSEYDDERMPPPEHHDPLTDEHKQVIKRWINEGAEYEPHWALQPIERPTVPEVHRPEWVRNPIDNFIMQRLEQEGLEPAGEADRRTLARRVSLDLTGLPPTPEQVEAFVNDESEGAYERYVDQMLSSVHWGEHRARYWLDVARYADTHGLHFDNYREIWAYRDWVINAFNENKPFDAFTIEQLAGDLLPDPSLDQMVATGFNRNNVTTNEGGTIPEEVLVQYMQDRVDTTTTAWLGLTAGCAACHDHKYDPLSQREYYELAAFFNNITQNAMDGNTAETPPIIFVPDAADRQRWDELPNAIAEAKAEVEAHKPKAEAAYAKWLDEREPQGEVTEAVSREKLHLQSLLTATDGRMAYELEGESRHVSLPDSTQWTQGPTGAQTFSSRGGTVVALSEAGDLEHDESFSYGAWVKLDGGNNGSFFGRMDPAAEHRGWDLWAEQGRVGMHLIHKWPGDALKVVTKDPVANGEWLHVFVTYDGSGKAAGVRVYVNGQQRETVVGSERVRNTTRTNVPLKLAQRDNGSRIDGLGLHDIRIYHRELAAAEVNQLANEQQTRTLLAKTTDELTEPEREVLRQWWINEHDEVSATLLAKVQELEDEKQALEERGTTTHVMQERKEPATAHVLFRGEYDQKLDEVSPGVPDMLPPMPEQFPNNRLGFAKWLLTDENPLTARVAVNRFWQEVFGEGIVGTAGDFGFAGEFPTHPQLLDWLAADFRESGWDVKQLFRTIVTSSAYRQAAVVDERKIEIDPDNRLLSRGVRFRMDGEMVRDYALASSGLLVPKIGGPSVKPYQPEGVWEVVGMPGSDTRFYERDTGDALYRRSVYTIWKRSAPPAFLEIFDATTREMCTITRDRTNTPLQALATLNDVQLVEAARHVAQRALLETDGSTDATLNHIASHLLLRPLRSDERTVLHESIEDLQAFYSKEPEQAGELVTYGESEPADNLEAPTLAAWTMLANQMLNLDEVLNK